jgi:hypothetical protein
MMTGTRDQPEHNDDQRADPIDVAKQKACNSFKGRLPSNGIDRVSWQHFIDRALLRHVPTGGEEHPVPDELLGRDAFFDI